MGKVGRLISFEGPDGSGKSTQMALLFERLRKEGYPVVLTRQPGGSGLGIRIRKILLDPKNLKLTERAELFLYLADRAQHVEEVVEPLVGRGKIVLTDRYLDSTWVYQGFGRGLPLDLIEACNAFAVAGRIPDVTLVFDVPAQVGLARLSDGLRDRMEAQSLSFHSRVRRGFRQLARRFPDRVWVVDGRGRPEAIHQQVCTVIARQLKWRLGHGRL